MLAITLLYDGMKKNCIIFRCNFRVDYIGFGGCQVMTGFVGKMFYF